MEESKEQLRAQGLGLAAVSYDSPAVLAHFAARKGIRFPLLSDAGSRVIRAFGLLNDEVDKNSPFFGIPHPVSLIVDRRGRVLSKHLEKDYRIRYTVSNILSEKFRFRNGAAQTVIAARRLKAVASASNAVIRPGERIRLLIDVELPLKMHVYAPGVQGYIPIAWEMNTSAGWKALPVAYPASKRLHLKAIGESAEVYEGKFTLQRELILGQAKELRAVQTDAHVLVEGTLRYQACDDKMCYVPETIPVRWKLRVEPHDVQRVPEPLRGKLR